MEKLSDAKVKKLYDKLAKKGLSEDEIFNEIYAQDCNLDHPTKYRLKQEHARQIAINWQMMLDSSVSHSWEWCASWSTRFERIGRKYGLLKEFRENGIL